MAGGGVFRSCTVVVISCAFGCCLPFVYVLIAVSGICFLLPLFWFRLALCFDFQGIPPDVRVERRWSVTQESKYLELYILLYTILYGVRNGKGK